MTLDLLVVIVTWNVRDLVLDALQSLYDDLAATSLNAAITVVDSASSDDTVEAVRLAFPQVHMIASQMNLGFGRANNTALRDAGFGLAQSDSLPRAVYLLNPDTITQPGATQALYDTLFSDESVGLVGAQLAYGDGTFQHGAFTFPGLRQLWVEFFPTPGRFIQGPFNGRYPQSRYMDARPFEVDFTLGATMMLRREVIEQTGMFDEDFFMYCEEIDWAWRIRKAGWRVLAVPSARVTHLAGKSTSQVRPQSTVHLWTSRLHLFKKHYPPWKRLAARLLVSAGMTRKVAQMRRDTVLAEDDRAAMIDAYLRVRRMALHG